jgi:RHS repeat-associated protein
MIVDNSKGIGIGYNMLNQPQDIGQGSIQLATYTYDANADKLSRLTGAIKTDYISGIQYDGTAATSTISFIQTEEGRAIPNGSTSYNYEYSLTDNLGNNRVNFDTGTGAVRQVQTDDYMPFGMEISRSINGTKNEYLYNKKELQENIGLYDYGARFYDPVIARWTVVDPMAEVSRRFSPYNYVEDNPIRNIDPDGMENDNYRLIRETLTPGSETLYGEEAQKFFKYLNAGQAGGPGGKKGGSGGKKSKEDQEREKQQQRNINDALFRALRAFADIAMLLVSHGEAESPYGDDETAAVSEVAPVVETTTTTAAEASTAAYVEEEAVQVGVGDRASEIHAAVPRATQTRTTIAVADAVDEQGNQVRVVGSSEPRLRVAQRAMLKPGEIEAKGNGHAEVTVLDHLRVNNLSIRSIGASRPVCANCNVAIESFGIKAATPLKLPKGYLFLKK